MGSSRWARFMHKLCGTSNFQPSCTNLIIDLVLHHSSNRLSKDQLIQFYVHLDFFSWFFYRLIFNWMLINVFIYIYIFIFLFFSYSSCHLACCSQFELDWQIHPGSQFIGFWKYRERDRHANLYRKVTKESFHLNRIIPLLGILSWGRVGAFSSPPHSPPPLTRAVNDKHIRQLGADRTSALETSRWGGVMK